MNEREKTKRVVVGMIATLSLAAGWISFSPDERNQAVDLPIEPVGRAVVRGEEVPGTNPHPTSGEDRPVSTASSSKDEPHAREGEDWIDSIRQALTDDEAPLLSKPSHSEAEIDDAQEKQLRCKNNLKKSSSWMVLSRNISSAGRGRYPSHIENLLELSNRTPPSTRTLDENDLLCPCQPEGSYIVVPIPRGDRLGKLIDLSGRMQNWFVIYESAPNPLGMRNVMMLSGAVVAYPEADFQKYLNMQRRRQEWIFE